MAARLGTVLYILGLILAALFVAGGIVVAINARQDAIWIAAIIWVLALACFLVGWACRYVLAGR